jgi:hypothetical protein
MRRLALRRAKFVAAVPLMLVLLGVCGCADAQTSARFTASSTPVPTRPAASAAGDTFTCALQTKSGSYPDLTLAVTAVNVDAAAFMSTVSPKRSAAVTALGKAGYSAVLSPGAGAGPGVEIGWLSGNNQLLVLRYRCAPAATSGDVDAVNPKLVELAKKIDQNSV